ncbi:hypothetical protein KJ359_007056 [Pestalotiopsis sp. 9143b]|nr:hypothetical protein KJ359_007056 [Pestalotiopsis sp. 9143b]
MSAANDPYNHFITQFARRKSRLVQDLFECFSLAIMDLYNYSLTDLFQRRIWEQPMTRYRHQWLARIRELVDYGCRDLDALIHEFYHRPGEEVDHVAMASFTHSEVDQFELAYAVTIYTVDRFIEACLDFLQEPVIGTPRTLVVLERPFGSTDFHPVALPNWTAIARPLLEGRCIVAIMTVFTTISIARDRFLADTLIDQVLMDAVITVEPITQRIERIHEDEEVVAITINSH